MPLEKPKPAQDIESLKKRHKELERQKTTAEANLKNALDQLEALKQEAREKYSTDDLDALRTLLTKMKSENEQKRAQYEKHLDEIETALAKVEADFNNPKPA